MNKRIVIMAGGTGGHVFPALAVAKEMLARGWQVSWLGTQNGLESKIVPANHIDMDYLIVHGVRGKNMLAKLKAILRIIPACSQALSILRKRNPQIVLAMGGFVAAPGGLMAKLMGIPVVIHEQNRIPGTTNRLLAKLAAKTVLEAFPDSFPSKVKAICTGNPLRNEFQHIPNKTLWSQQLERPLRVLVLGGSQGAKILNEVVPDALSMIKNLEIVHQTGSAMSTTVAEHYEHLQLSAKVYAFIEDMPKTYLWADLIICRAGAMTVSEVAACGLPAIFIPLMAAIDDHQTANARYLVEAGAALMLSQNILNNESLSQTVLQAMSQLTVMSQAAKKLASLNATETVADICIAEARI